MSKLSHVSDEKYHQFSSHHIFFSSIVSHFLMIKYLENGWTLSYGLESMHVLTVLNWMFYLWLNSDRNSSGRRQAHICDGNACIDWWMWHDIDTANRFINARYLYNARQHAFKHLVTNELTLFFSLYQRTAVVDSPVSAINMATAKWTVNTCDRYDLDIRFFFLSFIRRKLARWQKSINK